MYVYLSPNVERIAQDYGVISKIQALRDRIEADASLFNLLFDIRFPLWIRRMRNNLRLIAALKLYGEEQVLCLIHILPRGGSEYREFLNDPRQWEQHRVDLSSIKAYVEQRKQVDEITPSPMPDHLYPWLDRPTLMKRENGIDTVIFESKLWVELFQPSNSPLSQNLKSIYSIVDHLIFGTDQPYISEESLYVKGVRKCIDPETRYCILFSRIHPIDDPQREILFLFNLFDHTPTEAEIGNIGNQLDLFGSKASNNKPLESLTANELARYVSRSYPDYIASYFEHWQALELEPNTNLALSGEEEELLHGMNFPAFINGRAGSGKSTMLHYAFAYYCELYLQEVIEPSQQDFLPCPLFLTYSNRLTEKARDTVRRILTSHAYYISKGQFTTHQLNSLEKCFQTFQAFLLSCLPQQELQYFDRRKYISFHEFKQRYLKAFPKQEFSAEECWHTIRTYIKGYHFVDDHQDYLSIEEYQDEIDKKDKKVSNEDFKKIYNEIWKWYGEQCQNNHLWDDQDLARAVLKGIADGKISPANYAAIFCDEAQDFTRIEFQLILRLSVWSQYQLPSVVNSLPFAFAGDPLQTLNPTGFSWAGFCASFYEKILTPLDPDNSRKLDSERLVLHELQQNYRSPAAVVKFTNCIHLWRRTLFDAKTLEPQEAWRTTGGSQPQKGILGSNLTIGELKKLAGSGAIFLLPCDEGGELEFLQQTAILNEVFPSIKNGQVPPTVYTPVGLKGLELSPVVVCWFGDYYAKHFNEQPLKAITHTSSNLQLEYFLNKLYVAVSRSTDYLAIVDTQQGDQLLWQETAGRNISIWLNRMPLTTQQKQQHTTYLKKWKDNINSNIQPINMPGIVKIDLQFNGKQCLISGIENRSIHNLETAIFYYEKAGLLAEIDYCKAWILRLENKLQAAGRALMIIDALSDPDFSPQQEAWQCFWEGQCWQELSEWISRNQLSFQPMQQSAVQFMLGTENGAFPSRLITEFSTFLCYSQDSFWYRNQNDSTWRAVIDRYCQAVTDVLGQSQALTAKLWQLWSETLQKIAEAGYSVRNTIYLAGQCLYRSDDFAAAINLWEKQQYTTHSEYFIARAEILPAPENVSWFSKAKLFDRIVQIWKNSDRPVFGAWNSTLPTIREALRKTQQFSELLELEIQTRQWVAAVELCQRQNMKATERMRVIECMAHDINLTPESVREQREGLSQFVTQTIANSAWQATEARILEACVTIEKIGEYRSALPLFEQLMEIPHLSRAEQTFIQQRWLVVKGNQIEFLESRGKRREALRQRQERDGQAREWGITLRDLPLDVPTLPVSLQSHSLGPDHSISFEVEHLRGEISRSLDELTESELKQLNHYLQFLLYLRKEA